MTDPRSIAALDVAERHAKGEATDEELAAEADAAWVAAAARSAFLRRWVAADAAASRSSGVAERAAADAAVVAAMSADAAVASALSAVAASAVAAMALYEQQRWDDSLVQVEILEQIRKEVPR
jgi:hypothetical protein